MSSDSSSISLVVPGTAVTIAASLCAARRRGCINHRHKIQFVEHTKEIEQRAFAGVRRTKNGEADT